MRKQVWRLQGGLEQERLTLRMLIDNLPDGLFLKDRESRFTFANQFIAELMGAPDPSLLQGKTDSDFYAKEVAATFRADDRAVMESQKSLINKEESTSLSGRQRWFLTTKVPLVNTRGAVTGLLGITRDITQRKELERKNQQLATLVESSDDAIVGYDLNRRITVWNGGAERLYGYTEGEMVGTPTSQTIPPELEEEARLMREQVMQGGQVTRYETTRLRKDGSKIMVSLSLSAIRDTEGRIVGMASTAHDITGRKRAEEALRDSKRQLTDIIDFLPDATLAIDREGHVIIWNKAIERMTGIPAAQMIGRGDHAYTIPFYGEAREHLMDFVHKDCEEIPVRYSSITREGDTLSAEVFCNALYNNKGAWVYSKVSPLCDKSGSIIGVIESIRDITERKQAEEVLRESQRRLSDIVDFLPDATFAIDTEGTITAWNRAIEQMTGKTKEQMLGRRNYEYAIPFYGRRYPMLVDLIFDNREEIKEKYAFVDRRGDTPVGEGFAPLLREGKGAHFWGAATILRNERGKIVGAIESIRDITDRKRAEEEKAKLEGQLQQAQKMESVGRLAGGVAHDFNNMLVVILGHTEMALEQVDPTQSLHADLEEIRKAAERSAALTRQLLAFARKQTVAPRVLDLNQIVEGMLTMLERLVGENVHLTWQPKADLWPVMVDRSQIDQILTNLCVNARDAIADVGKITIETGNSAIDEAYCADHPGFVAGEYVLLAVTDDGRGMDKETQSHLFEPFFTTKEMGKGTGLGLATVYGIVKQNNGFINVYSEPGHGTRFTIYLLRHSGKTEQARGQEAEGSAQRGHETILLVEDELASLNLIRKMLERQGYIVLAASTPGEAIRLAREHAGEIHLLMTDVVMPEMNGRDLARRLLSLFPHLKRLFASGYTANVIAHQGVLDEGMHFIQKPFSRKDLAAKVREALDSE